MSSISLIFALFCFKYSFETFKTYIGMQIGFNFNFGLQKQLCYDDDECLTNAVIDKVYPRFVAGMPGVESSDPLRLDVVVVDLPTIKYLLNSASLVGLKDCQFVKLNNTRLGDYTIFDYALECPVLTLSSEYELNGIIDSIPIQGKGTIKIIYDDYYVPVSGKHQKVKDNAGKLHVNIIEYSVIPVLKGGVKQLEYTNLILGDNYIRIIEEITRETVMDAFMNKLIHNLKNFHQLVPIEDMHFKYVQSN